jgi:hypothetical protein
LEFIEGKEFLDQLSNYRVLLHVFTYHCSCRNPVPTKYCLVTVPQMSLSSQDPDTLNAVTGAMEASSTMLSCLNMYDLYVREYIYFNTENLYKCR